MQVKEIDKLELVDTVRRSLGQYGEMAELLRVLQQQLDADPAGYIDEFNISFTELQKKAQQLDRYLLEQLRKSDDWGETVEFYLDKRKKMQTEIQKMLEQALPRAISIKSLLASEIQSLKTGRNALSGYKNKPTAQGRLINKRS